MYFWPFWACWDVWATCFWHKWKQVTCAAGPGTVVEAVVSHHSSLYCYSPSPKLWRQSRLRHTRPVSSCWCNLLRDTVAVTAESDAALCMKSKLCRKVKSNYWLWCVEFFSGFFMGTEISPTFSNSATLLCSFLLFWYEWEELLISALFRESRVLSDWGADPHLYVFCFWFGFSVCALYPPDRREEESVE